MRADIQAKYMGEKVNIDGVLATRRDHMRSGALSQDQAFQEQDRHA
jgi:hypothetical protein